MVGDIDYHLATMIPIWINELKSKNPGLSRELFDGLEMSENYGYSEENEKIAKERCDIILDKIFDGFKSYIELNYKYDVNNNNDDELKKKFDEEFDLFHKYFHTLNN